MGTHYGGGIALGHPGFIVGNANACYPFCSDAEDVGVLKSASQFPCMVHEEDLTTAPGERELAEGNA